MSYGRIRRGPMAADAFTQIRNAVFRDARLSAKAMGIFGNISTHRDGWGITPESLSTQMRDGVDAIKSGLRELEQYGYLRRTQTKGPGGMFGAAVYYITDQPEPFQEALELESPSSEPLVDYPLTVNPPAGSPLAGDHPHKKTISKHTSPKKTLSPPPPRQAPVTDERETFAKAMNDDTAKVAEAWSAARGGRRNSASEEQVRCSAASLLAVGWSIPDLIALAEDMAAKYPKGTDLTVHERHWSAGQPTAVVRLAKWCGCGGNPVAEFNGRFRTHNGLANGQPCLICHPDALQESA